MGIVLWISGFFPSQAEARPTWSLPPSGTFRLLDLSIKAYTYTGTRGEWAKGQAGQAGKEISFWRGTDRAKGEGGRSGQIQEMRSDVSQLAEPVAPRFTCLAEHSQGKGLSVTWSHAHDLGASLVTTTGHEEA